MWCVLIVSPTFTSISLQYPPGLPHFYTKERQKCSHVCHSEKALACVNSSPPIILYPRNIVIITSTLRVTTVDVVAVTVCSIVPLHTLPVCSRLGTPHQHVTCQHYQERLFCTAGWYFCLNKNLNDPSTMQHANFAEGRFISSLSSSTSHVTNIRLMCCLFGSIRITHRLFWSIRIASWRTGLWLC